ncbi:hypothetical protein R6Q59_019095 [Mikania micrantha]
MARSIDLSGYNGGATLEFEGSQIVLLLCMILVSISVLSMVIFACGDQPPFTNPTQEDPSSNKGSGIDRDQGSCDCYGGGVGGDGGVLVVVAVGVVVGVDEKLKPRLDVERAFNKGRTHNVLRQGHWEGANTETRQLGYGSPGVIIGQLV